MFDINAVHLDGLKVGTALEHRSEIGHIDELGVVELHRVKGGEALEHVLNLYPVSSSIDGDI